jgi:hypothetical protein
LEILLSEFEQALAAVGPDLESAVANAIQARVRKLPSRVADQLGLDGLDDLDNPRSAKRPSKSSGSHSNIIPSTNQGQLGRVATEDVGSLAAVIDEIVTLVPDFPAAPARLDGLASDIGHYVEALRVLEVRIPADRRGSRAQKARRTAADPEADMLPLVERFTDEESTGLIRLLFIDMLAQYRVRLAALEKEASSPVGRAVYQADGTLRGTEGEQATPHLPELVDLIRQYKQALSYESHLSRHAHLRRSYHWFLVGRTWNTLKRRCRKEPTAIRDFLKAQGQTGGSGIRLESMLMSYLADLLGTGNKQLSKHFYRHPMTFTACHTIDEGILVLMPAGFDNR